MLAVVFIVTLLLSIYIIAIGPIMNDPEYKEKYSKSPLFLDFCNHCFYCFCLYFSRELYRQ